MKLKYILFIFCVLLLGISTFSGDHRTAASTDLNPSSVMKVKPHYSTAVYEENSKQSKKLFHTKVNQHIIVHNKSDKDWYYIQDGEQFGYIASKSLTDASSFTVQVNSKKGLLVRTTPNFKHKAIHTLSHKHTMNAYSYNDEWHIVKLENCYGYAPVTRLQKTVMLKNEQFGKGQASEQKRVALTFDDGPNTIYTKAILDTLKKYNVKATFFVVGSNVKRNPTIAKRIVQEGHEIGNHTYNHPKLTAISMKKIQQEIASSNKVIFNATGTHPTVFRPPYGAVNKAIINKVQLPSIMWSVDTLDWEHRNPKKLLQIVQKNVENGSIILMHDTNSATQKGLESVIRHLQQNGYILVTASELLGN